MLQQNKGAFLALCSNMYVQLDFKENHFFLKVSFHREIFVATSFGIVLGVRIVHAVVFIKKKRNGHSFLIV